MSFLNIGAITTGMQTVTSTGALSPTGGLDVSAISRDWTLFVAYASLTAHAKAKVQIETSVDGTNWMALHVMDLEGELQPTADRVYSLRKYQAQSASLAASAAFGAAGGLARANLLALETPATLELRSWVGY